MNAPTLLLLHGLGATRGVWADVERSLDWPGRVVVPELPGHGHAAPQDDYTLGALAAAVAGACDDREEIVAIGHSLGGAVAMCLASGFFRPVVSAAVSIGMKIAWSDADVEGMAKVASKGVRWFETRDEAVDRFLLQSGLTGLVPRDHPAIETAVRNEDEGWRTSQDPRTFAQRPVDTSGLMSAATCPVVLAAGESDAMVSVADLEAHVPDPRIAPGSAHNVHVEDPEWVAALIREVAGDPSVVA